VACCDPLRKNEAKLSKDWMGRGYSGNWALDICRNERSKAPSGASKRGATVAQQDSSSAGFVDKTKEWTKKMTLSCKHYVQSSASVLGSKEWEKLPEGPNPNSLDLKGLGGKPELYGKIVCAERSYPEEARAAFATMGDRFFPPLITLGDPTTLRLSCGKQQVQLDMYAGCHHNGWATGPLVSKDPAGRDVSRTLAAMKLDGGKAGHFTCENEKRSASFGKCAKVRLGLLTSIRRNGKCFTTVDEKMRGEYRPANSGPTNTCCPPLGLGGWANNVHDWPVPKPTDKVCRNDKGTQERNLDPQACYRQMYGTDTQKCESDLQLKILECDCKKGVQKCKKKDGKMELVRITIAHKLLTKNTKGACKPWFVLMDAGVRAYIAKFRQKINAAVASRCKSETLGEGQGRRGGGGLISSSSFSLRSSNRAGNSEDDEDENDIGNTVASLPHGDKAQLLAEGNSASLTEGRRGGGGFQTSSTFSLASGNRAGNSEDDEVG